MSRPIKLLVGFLTSVPLIYFGLFFCFIVGTVIWAQGDVPIPVES